MPTKVVDASVMAALIYEEPRAEEADALLRGAELHAPLLMAYELTNIARKKADQHPVRREELVAVLEAALAMDIHWRDVRHTSVLQIALETGLSTYDACYLYLSRLLGAGLVTFDRRLGRMPEASGS